MQNRQKYIQILPFWVFFHKNRDKKCYYGQRNQETDTIFTQTFFYDVRYYYDMEKNKLQKNKCGEAIIFY